MQLTIHGARIALERTEAGTDGAPEVLMLHGWGCDSTFFTPIAGAFARDANVTVPDFPAFGKSGRPPEPWGVPEYADAVRGMLSELNIPRAHIIAHSFGGRVAIQLAATHPELVGKLILTGCAGIRKPMNEAQKKRQARYRRARTFLEAMRNVPLAGGATDALLERLRKKYGSADYAKLDEEMRKTFVKVISLDLKPQLALIQSPTLLVWGENDTETPLWMGETMEKTIPDAGLVVFEGGDHFAYLREWQRFVTIARRFLLEE